MEEPPPKPLPAPDKLAEALRERLREEHNFWDQAQEMAPKLRMLALAVFVLAVLFFVGVWLLQQAVEGKKAVLEKRELAR